MYEDTASKWNNFYTFMCVQHNIYCVKPIIILIDVDLVHTRKSYAANTTASGGSLGLPVDEERSKLR